MIGFPTALIAAWMMESKPHEAVAAAVRSKSTTVDWLLIGAVAVLIALTGYQQLAPRQAGVDAARSASLDPRVGVALAVLPFANLSDDETQTFFSDGITEEIITALARIPDLRVVARESASQFKGERRDLRAVGQSLGATHLIEGSVRKAGARVRITARLVKADDGVNAWSNSFDRELTDVFAIQEEIATSIAGALRMPLGLNPGEQLVANRAIDPESYQQFLRGKAALGRARNAYAEQLALLEPVVQKNPRYAPAWAALARAYGFAALVSTESIANRDMYRAKSVAAAQRAVELDPNLLEGQVELARTLRVAGNWARSEDVLLKALMLDPNSPEALAAYAGMLLPMGRLQEGLALRERLYAVEPYIPIHNGNLAQARWLNGQTDVAISLFKGLLDNQGAGARADLSQIYASLGRYAEAADLLEGMLSNQRNQPYSEIISATVQLLRSAPTKVSEPEKLPRLAEGSFAYLHVGAPGRVLDFYEEGTRGAGEYAVLWHASYAPVRKTERFKKLVRDLGLVDYWRARGWPDLCRPVGADDFECQ